MNKHGAIVKLIREIDKEEVEISEELKKQIKEIKRKIKIRNKTYILK